MVVLEKARLFRKGNLADDVHGIIIAEVNGKIVVFLVQLPENHGISTVNAFEEIASIVKNHYKLPDNVEFYQVVYLDSLHEWQISKVTMEIKKDKNGNTIYDNPGWEDVVRYTHCERENTRAVDEFKEYPGYEGFLTKEDIVNFEKWWRWE